jgi:hypothetical protein
MTKNVRREVESQTACGRGRREIFIRMKTSAMTCGCCWLLALAAWAGAAQEFPAHWGAPPAVQTQDYVELPGGYGHGSSTLARWIAANLEKDKQRPAPKSAAPAVRLYANNFEQAQVGKLPEDFLSLNGEFAVKAEAGNKLLELPGAPLDSFGVLFGPTASTNVAVSARIFGTAKGRRYPTFGVGLCGVSGYKLQVAPAKKALELLKDEAVQASVPFDWKTGTWTHFRLQVRAAGGGWRIEGKAWPQDGPEPKDWMLAFDEKEEPAAGRFSVLGSPFSGMPIWFDDLMVEKTE